jgi:hypothetical protein
MALSCRRGFWRTEQLIARELRFREKPYHAARDFLRLFAPLPVRSEKRLEAKNNVAKPIQNGHRKARSATPVIKAPSTINNFAATLNLRMARVASFQYDRVLVLCVTKIIPIFPPSARFCGGSA